VAQEALASPPTITPLTRELLTLPDSDDNPKDSSVFFAVGMLAHRLLADRAQLLFTLVGKTIARRELMVEFDEDAPDTRATPESIAIAMKIA